MSRPLNTSCYFGCVIDGSLHKFPKPISLVHWKYNEQRQRFHKWLAVLDTKTIEKGENYIHHSIRLCHRHFEDCYKLPSGLLTKNAIPTLSIDKQTSSDINTDVIMAAKSSNEDSSQFASEKTEEMYNEWETFYGQNETANVLKATAGANEYLKNNPTETNADSKAKAKGGSRWVFAMRHGERVDFTYGSWVPHCFPDNNTYVRKDLNMPLKLGERAGGGAAYARDTPLTRVGALQAWLVGEALREANVSLDCVYASSALRSVETAHHVLLGLQADPSIKIKVEPGLYDYKEWCKAQGISYMTPLELHKAGLNVDLSYEPYVHLDEETSETIDELYKRNEYAMQSAVKDKGNDGKNILFVGHATTPELAVSVLKRLNSPGAEFPPYQFGDLLRVPYCAVGALAGPPWRVRRPPVAPLSNTAAPRYDWTQLLDVERLYS